MQTNTYSKNIKAAVRLMKKEIRRLGRLREKGAVAVEFALIAPLFFLLLMAIVELSIMLFVTAVMEGAIGITARIARTGYAPDGTPRSDKYIRGEFLKYTARILDDKKLDFSAQAYEKFSDIGNAVPIDSIGESEQVVVYRARYPWPIITPGVAFFFANNQDGDARIIDVTRVEKIELRGLVEEPPPEPNPDPDPDPDSTAETSTVEPSSSSAEESSNSGDETSNSSEYSASVDPDPEIGPPLD